MSLTSNLESQHVAGVILSAAQHQNSLEHRVSFERHPNLSSDLEVARSDDVASTYDPVNFSAGLLGGRIGQWVTKDSFLARVSQLLGVIALNPQGRPSLDEVAPQSNCVSSGPGTHYTLCNMSTPIHYIPVELLGEIFMWCLPHDDEIFQAGLQVTCLALGQVCRYWRAVALSMPMLWSSIAIYRPRRCHIALANIYLHRSALLPLSLYILECPSPSPEEQSMIGDILSLLVCHSRRWKNIRFTLYGSVQQPLIDLPDDGCPLLESANLDLCCWDNDSVESLVNKLYMAPHFRRFSWRKPKALPANVPWFRLTRVTLGCSISVDECLDVLQQCPRVVEFDITRIIDAPSVSPRSPITLPDLRSFAIHTHDSLETMFSQLVLPSLRSIAISHMMWPSTPRNWQSLGCLLARSSCQLEKFTLDDPSLCEDDLIQYLTIPDLKFLVELHILMLRVSDKTLALLTASRDRSLFPRLEIITLERCGSSDGVLADMVASRRVTHPLGTYEGSRGSRAASLRHVKAGLEPAAPSHDHDMSRLGCMSNDGLVLDIRYYW